MATRTPGRDPRKGDIVAGRKDGTPLPARTVLEVHAHTIRYAVLRDDGIRRITAERRQTWEAWCKQTKAVFEKVKEDALASN